MADSQIELISKNLQSTLNGKIFVYNGVNNTSTCERQRSVRQINNRYPFIELCGPWVEVINKTSCTADLKLFYVVEFREARINDDYSPATTTIPISEKMGNIASEIQRLVKIDSTRGGYAYHTTWSDFGYYIDVEDEVPEFVVYQNIEIDAKVNIDNP